jgi:hypothetical protein
MWGGGDVDGLSLSRCVVVGGGAFFWRGGGCEAPRDLIFDVVLIVWVPEGLNFTWRSQILPGRAYPASELSWQLCVFL